MALGGGETLEAGGDRAARVMSSSSSKVDLVMVLLRVLALLATVSAALIMGFNKQTRTIVVATIGTTTVQATLTAKFQHTPAFVFFVIANGIASLHNLLMLVVSFIGPPKLFERIAPSAIPVFDLMNVAIVSGGASAAAFMGQLGRDGNSHARWNKICDKIDSFCDRGGGAMIASFIGLVLIIIICSLSIIRLRRYNTI
ncbi:PREDICTED: CASP-like protein 1B2 [Erythranthe guttata]|uniref:CASP-like protein 1B2 n=1 Tax=Erythranthe guttata TaxID=4155 RepID=UPI00064D8156|nr:PREDICTED: CASP-like protein 1B2 [Erythranthe guttata]|eukprot:XP_012827575.1 PREDICTED: CASP-like protein 1B2 [Erythranthe guttata]